MPPAVDKANAPVAFIWGDDEFSVKKRARQIFTQWASASGSPDQEIIEASVTNSGDALKSIGRLREAIQTLPFFGTGKIVWWQNVNYLGEDRVAGSKSVTEALTELAETFKTFRWEGVRLLISSGKADRRRAFFKTLEKLALVEHFAELTTDDRDWADKAAVFARNEIKTLNKEIAEDALDELVACSGPNTRQLRSESEKLALYVGERPRITVADVQAIVTRQKQSQAFALGEALGDRDLPRLLKALDESLWEMKFDSQKSAIGVLYLLISKVRVMLFLKEMLRLGWVKPTNSTTALQAQLSKLPADMLPEDKKLNPLAMHPYVLLKAIPQAAHYTLPELVSALEALLECNTRLIFSGMDESIILQQTLVGIVSRK